MANIRQYIGARYVIKIYENSQDPSSAEWEQGNFEPLVMVTWQNGSYLSKKEVPGSVGNPASNPDYWVQTGFYNGQIASLQQQVNALQQLINDMMDGTISGSLQNQIDTLSAANANLNKKKSNKLLSDCRFVFITDSFGAFNNNEGKNFCQVVADVLNLDAADYAINYTGSKGFKNDEYTELLQAVDITDKDTVDYVIAIGGNNDRHASNDDIKSGMDSFVQECHTSYPNANVIIAYDAWNYGTFQSTAYFLRTYMLYKEYSQILGAEFCDMMTAIHSYSYCADGIHPTASGVDRLATSLLKYLTSRDGSLDVGLEYVTFTSDVVTAQSGNLKSMLLDDEAVMFTDTPVTLTIDNMNMNNNELKNLGTVTGGCINFRESYYWNIVPVTITHSTGTSYRADIGLMIYNGELLIRNFSGSSFSAITSMIINPFSFALPAHIC